METHRLKNIIIIVLLTLNVFLLVLLMTFRLQNTRAQQNMVEQLYILFESSDISLHENLPLDAQPLTTLDNQRDQKTEAAIAASLLGEAVSANDQGGGIYSYSGTHGTVHFRSNGFFDYLPENQTVEAPRNFCTSFCEDYGYTVDSDALVGKNGTLSATRVTGGSPVYNCTVSFRFEDGKLLSVSGAYVSETNNSAQSVSSLGAVDALVRFLDYRNQNGVICNAISDISPVYELRSSPSSPLQLVAKWQIVTDTYRYYVDCATGNVIRA